MSEHAHRAPEKRPPLGAADVLAVFVAAAVAEAWREYERWVPSERREEHRAEEHARQRGIDGVLAQDAARSSLPAIRRWMGYARLLSNQNRERERRIQ